jgi:hypothetical protein
VLVVQLPAGAGDEVEGSGLAEVGVDVGLLGVAVGGIGSGLELLGVAVGGIGSGLALLGVVVGIGGSGVKVCDAGAVEVDPEVEVAGAALCVREGEPDADTRLSWGWQPATAAMAATAMAAEKTIRGGDSLFMSDCLSKRLGAAPRTLTVR